MPVHTNAEINVIVRKVILSKCKLQTSFSFFFSAFMLRFLVYQCFLMVVSKPNIRHKSVLMIKQ